MHSRLPRPRWINRETPCLARLPRLLEGEQGQGQEGVRELSDIVW